MASTITWHSLAVNDVIQRLGTSLKGLSSGEVVKRLGRSGRNEITRRQPVAPFRLLLKQFANFFALVLLFAALLAFAVSFLHERVVDVALNTLSLAVATIPESLPIVPTFALAEVFAVLALSTAGYFPSRPKCSSG